MNKKHSLLFSSGAFVPIN